MSMLRINADSFLSTRLACEFCSAFWALPKVVVVVCVAVWAFVAYPVDFVAAVACAGLTKGTIIIRNSNASNF